MMTLSMNENEMKIFWRHWFWEPIRTNYVVVVGCGLLCGCRGGWHTWTQSAHHTSPASKDWSDPWMVVVVMCRTLMKSCIQVCVKTCNTAKKLRVVCVKLWITFKTLLLNDQARHDLPPSHYYNRAPVKLGKAFQAPYLWNQFPVWIQETRSTVKIRLKAFRMDKELGQVTLKHLLLGEADTFLSWFCWRSLPIEIEIFLLTVKSLVLADCLIIENFSLQYSVKYLIHSNEAT